MLKKIKNNRLIHVLGASWIICMISHVILPVLIAFPIFSRIHNHGHGACGHSNSLSTILFETLVFICIVVPSSILVAYVYSKIKKNRNTEILICDNCPHNEQAFGFVKNKECS